MSIVDIIVAFITLLALCMLAYKLGSSPTPTITYGPEKRQIRVGDYISWQIVEGGLVRSGIVEEIESVYSALVRTDTGFGEYFRPRIMRVVEHIPATKSGALVFSKAQLPGPKNKLSV